MKKQSYKGKSVPSSENKIKLPLIKINKGRNLPQKTKNKINLNKETKSPIKIENNNDKKNDVTEEIIKESKSNIKNIDDIIKDVNKSHNIFSKINSVGNEKEKENNDESLSNILDLNKKIVNSTISGDKNGSKVNNIKKKNYNIPIKKQNKTTIKDNAKEVVLVPRITKEKLKELQEKRRKRLVQEQKEKEILSKMMEDIKNSNNTSTRKTDDTNNMNYEIKISQKNVLSTLEEGGIIEAYKNLINNLRQNGIPPGNIYEYSAKMIRDYEKEWKKKKFIKQNEKIEKYFEEKKQNYLKNLSKENKDQDKNNNNLIYKILKDREANQFIKKLDRSRSTLHVIKNISELKGSKTDLTLKTSIKKIKKIIIKNKDKNKSINNIKEINNSINSNKDVNDSQQVLFKITLKKSVESPKKESSIENKNNKANLIKNKLSLNKSFNPNSKKKIIGKDNKKLNKSINIKK